ncbi:MAG: SGNH/GDSL hydrolase family protein [Planctomycetia bacterium]|nr:SGNH/GDSL hydrolase family protein [Planctomycetia bacterium]
MQRRYFLQTVWMGSVALGLRGGLFAEEAKPSCQWINLEKLPLEGRAWENEERATPYVRFPKRWMDKMPGGVRGNAQHSSGIVAHFTTNSSQILLRCSVVDKSLAMNHMPATGKSGFDLYCKDDAGTFRFVTNTVPREGDIPFPGRMGEKKEREYMLYFPLYNQASHVEIGLDSDATFAVVPVEKKPMLFYGTSIVHGACASRPGMPHPAILGRRLGRPFWNFGFSGSGKMEPVLAEAFAELDPCIYILDCLPNMNPPLVTERAAEFVRILRKARPETPILLVEDRVAPVSWIHAGRADFHKKNHAALKAQYELLLAEGVKKLGYLGGDGLLPPDGDGTVDNSHPTDWGFLYHANVMQPKIEELLQ